jgi:AcrR family transcriptional regulator
MEAAWNLFNERGYDDTAVEDITEVADVAKGTFFNYFPSKEAIVDHIARWRIELLGARVLNDDDVPDRAVDRIKLLMKAMVDEFSPERSFIRHMYLVRTGPPMGRESAHRIGSLVHELVVQGQKEGEIRADVEPGFVAHLLMFSWFHYFGRWKHHQEEDFPEEAKLMHSVDVLMQGLQGEEGRST